MKRLTLLTILLVVVGLTAGALEVKPAFTLSGSATVKWGYDLLTDMHGFNNTASADLVVTLMAADGSDTKAAKDGWYGSITLSNVDASLDAPNGVVIPAPTVAAKIVGMGGDLNVTIFGGPSLAIGNAGFVPLYSADAGYTKTGDVDPKATTKGGLTVAYTLKGIGTLTAKVASIGDWGVTAPVASSYKYEWVTVTGAEVLATDVAWFEYDGTLVVLDANPLTIEMTPGAFYVKRTVVAAVAASAGTDYAFGADFSLSAVKDLTFTAGAFYGLGSRDLGIGAKAGYTVAGLTASVGVDVLLDWDPLALPPAYVTSYDLAGSIAYSFMEAKDKVTLAAYYTSASRLDLGLLISDAEGFVKGLTIGAGVYVYDLLGAMPISFGETISYKAMLGDVNYVKPYETVKYDVAANELYLNVGVDVMLIPNTVFKIDFVGGKVGNDNNASLVGTDISGYQVLSVSTTITY